MSRRTLLPLVALVAVLAIGIAWLVRGELNGPEREISQPAFSVPPSPSSSPPEPVQLTATEKGTIGQTPTDPLTPAIASPRTADGRTSAVSTEGDRELQEAIWVEGRVVIPEGTPPDEHVEILADGRKFKSRPPHRRPIESDGSFRVAFARGTEVGVLTLEARYLYLEDRVSISHSTPPKNIVLKPKIGGVIRGLLVPSDSSSSSRMSLVGCRVRASGHLEVESTQSSGSIERVARVSPTLEFELGGLPEIYVYQISIRTFGIAAPSPKEVEVEAGKVSQVTFEIPLGVRVSGHVVDEKNTPVGSIWIHAYSHSVDGTLGYDVATSTDSRGAFSLAGIHPGTVTLRAEGPDSRWAALNVGDLIDGARQEGVEIVLKSTQTIAGRVVWPDGTPATDCAIRYGYERIEEGWGKIYEEGQVSSDGNGQFRIVKMGDEPVGLTARADPPPRIFEPRDPQPGPETRYDLSTWVAFLTNHAPWVAHLKGVNPGTDALILTLDPAASIRGRVLDEEGHPIAKCDVHADQVREPKESWSRSGYESETHTDETGGFFLGGLHEGSWDVTAESRGYADTIQHAVTIPGNGSPTNLVLKRSATLSGVVVDPSGKPVAHAAVKVNIPDPNTPGAIQGWISESRTDSQGRFAIENVTPGPVMLSAEARRWSGAEMVPLDIQSGQVITSLTLRLGPPKDESRAK
jgi:protocatechuate 3,4-dioxygenase beta subunit